MHNKWRTRSTLQRDFRHLPLKHSHVCIQLNNKKYKKTKRTLEWGYDTRNARKQNLIMWVKCLSFFIHLFLFALSKVANIRMKERRWELIFITGHTESGGWFSRVTTFSLLVIHLFWERFSFYYYVKQSFVHRYGSWVSFETLQPSNRYGLKYLDLGLVILQYASWPRM